MGYVYIGLTVLFTVYGQLIIKQQTNTLAGIPSGAAAVGFLLKFIFTRPLVLSGFVSAFLASLAWIGAISRFELSYAYPFMSLNFFVVVVLSVLFFNEALNIYKVVGLTFICLGVFIVAKGV